MAKFYGAIGYEDSSLESPGVWVENIIERQYFGDLRRNSRRLQSSDSVNDNVTISNEISIVADPYAMQNFHRMRYVTFMGTKWKISSVEEKYPRLLLTIGGVYNAESDTTA